MESITLTLNLVYQTIKRIDVNIIAKLYRSYVGSKFTRSVRQNKNMIPISNKQEEIYANLWGLHDSLSQSGNIYATILMYKHICKLWILYLRGKDDFIDVFQVWLSRIKAKSRCLIKILWADGVWEFILVKLQLFCKKQGIAIKYVAPYIHKENRQAKQGWQTIMTIKDSVLFDSGLSNGF